MKAIAIAGSGLVLIAGAFYIGSRMADCPPGKVCILETNTDPSPIIVTDGNSIHFAEYDQWTYISPQQIAALLPGHHSHSVKVGLCAQDPNESAAAKCGADLVNQRVAGKSWKLYLCESLCVSDGSNAVSTISLDKNSTYGADKGSDLIVDTKGRDLQGEMRSPKDGARFYLDSVHLRYALLIIENTLPGYTADCHTSDPSTNACVVRVCYANSPLKCQ